MKITLIGTGYVGLVTGVALAADGHRVICVGRNQQKIDQINSGSTPFFEPSLDELLKTVIAKNWLHASGDFNTSVKNSDVIIIAVGTPTKNNTIDLSFIKQVAKQIGNALKGENGYRLIMVKSTVLPGVTENIVKPIIERYSKMKIGEFGLCMNPEFLREGNAVSDATKPDRIVIGAYDQKSGELGKKVYQSFDCPKVVTTIKTAEMIKYAANSLFATMISYANEIANISEAIGGIDVVDVWKGVHLDSRIHPAAGMLSYIRSGCGYGGSCFPKDVKALSHLAQKLNVSHDMLKSVISTNDRQPYRVVRLVKQALGPLKGKRIAVLGLAFKPNTDDTRESPSLAVVNLLQKEGAEVVTHDPVVSSEVKTSIGAIKGSDAVIVLTAWDEYKKITPDLLKKYMKNPVIVDGRRIYNKQDFLAHGVVYKGVGLN